MRESLYLEDFSGNRSVLFPSALDTIVEEDSSRVIQNLQVLDHTLCLTLSDMCFEIKCETHTFRIIVKHTPFESVLTSNDSILHRAPSKKSLFNQNRFFGTNRSVSLCSDRVTRDESHRVQSFSRVKHHVFSSNLLVICSICSKTTAVCFSNHLSSKVETKGTRFSNHKNQSTKEDYLNSYTDINKNISSL